MRHAAGGAWRSANSFFLFVVRLLTKKATSICRVGENRTDGLLLKSGKPKKTTCYCCNAV